MNFSQIEKVYSFCKRLDAVHGVEQMELYANELISYYDSCFNIQLDVKGFFNTPEAYSVHRENKDKAAIKGFLDSIIEKSDTSKAAFEIIELIEEGNKSIGNYEKMAAFVSKAYFSYNGVIKFDKTTESAATEPSECFNLGTFRVDENMVRGIITKLNAYGKSLLSKPSAAKQSGSPSVVINNTNSTTVNTNVDITISVEQAKQQVEDAGFGDQQYTEIIKKLAEIESIGKSDASKGNKWGKAKEILKWCAEQGIEIAKIVLPLLPQMLGK